MRWGRDGGQALSDLDLKGRDFLPSSAVRANVSHGRRCRASVFEFWMTTTSLTRRSTASASDDAAAVARATSRFFTNAS